MRERRRFYGEHLTPVELARRYILPHVKDRLWNHLWVDLFCGEGSLLLPLIEEIPPALRVKFFEEHILMFDIQPDQVVKAIKNVIRLGIPEAIARRRILIRDTLGNYPHEFLNKHTIHITNPPYLYIGYIAKRAREHLKYFTGSNAGYQDLYQIALINDLKMGLNEMIYIIPTNFLFGDAISNKIRMDVLSYYKISRAILFETRVFKFTGTNVGIFFFRRKTQPTTEVQRFRAVKVTPTGEKIRVYTLKPEYKYRAGMEFEEFVNKHRAKNPPKVRFYLRLREVMANPGSREVILVDANSYNGHSYKLLRFYVNDYLYRKIKSNILFARTVDTGGEERAGLYLIKDTFNADGIVVTKAAYRTHPIQLFFEPTLSIEEQLRLKDYFNSTLERLRTETDSEFMTTFKYSNSEYTRKYLGLKQIRKLIETYDLGRCTHVEEKFPLLGDLFNAP